MTTCAPFGGGGSLDAALAAGFAGAGFTAGLGASGESSFLSFSTIAARARSTMASLRPSALPARFAHSREKRRHCAAV